MTTARTTPASRGSWSSGAISSAASSRWRAAPSQRVAEALHSLGAVRRDSVLLDGLRFDTAEEAARVARQYWEIVVEQFPEWQEVRRGRLPAGDIRRDFIHSHGIVLHALGRVGNTLLHQTLNPEDWRDRVKRIGTLDWSRANTRLWEGRALVGGRVSKATNNVTLTTNALRQHLGLPLPRGTACRRRLSARTNMTDTRSRVAFPRASRR